MGDREAGWESSAAAHRSKERQHSRTLMNLSPASAARVNMCDAESKNFSLKSIFPASFSRKNLNDIFAIRS
jgi:hypothetical protein